MEEKKSSYATIAIMACLVMVLSISIAVYMMFFQKPNGKTTKNSTNTKELSLSAITGAELDKIEPEDGYLVFYKGDKKISAIKCDGKCYVDDFVNSEPDEIKSDYTYVNPIAPEEGGTRGKEKLDLSDLKYVFIEYCPKGICTGIDFYGGDYFHGKDENSKNVGTVLLFDIENGKYEEYKGINKVMNLYSEDFIVLSSETNDVLAVEGDHTSYVEKHAVLFNDGTYRALDNIISTTCYEGCYPDMILGDDIVTITKDGKYGIENLKTGKEIIAHKYQDIVSIDNNSSNTPIDGTEGHYIKLKENDKYNMYDTNGFKQLTKNGYDAIYLISKDKLLVYNDGSFYFIDFNENVLSEKIALQMSQTGKKQYYKYFHDIGGQPHESNVMFKKADDNTVSIRLVPDFSKYETKYYYNYDLNTNTFTVLTDNSQIENVWGY